MALTNDYTPIYVGDTRPLVMQFVDKSGNPIPLVGLDPTTALSIRMQDIKKGTIINGVGTWNIVDDVNAIASYTWGPNETATAGLWGLEFTVIYSDGIETFDPPQPLEIRTKF